MGISKPPSLPISAPQPILLFPTVLLSLVSLLAGASAANIYDLIYKGCANQQFPGGGAGGAQQTLASLSSTIISQSAASKFYKTTTSSSSGQPIFGLFQCRGDLSSSDCAACVAKAVQMWSSLCGATVAARIQLAGCYSLYEISGFPQVSGTQMLYKTCGSGGGGGEGFEEKRDTALSSLENGVTGGGGFFATSYQSVYAMAQCEGDLSSADCGECVQQAVQKSQVECGGASSGQVYLDKCYISYNYYPNGVPHGGGSGGGGGGGGGGDSVGGGQQTGKTVAIVVGGAAALGFLVICLLFARNLMKKKDDY
ncbi:plasmodesmata-located protein 3 [Dendrobium catenatum]|uniref:Cysteine-rich repeat secretory protein 11 n=1 Tax=Dendrobium catenatum TaxID=906689 RepID=A0A2I0XAQ6_9ASPA|nr:plasmodesmata-located protein 3 [Dendrobium catenatum]PKU84995.1 Cysteine-rich repeat secretory protein 11 [Dendrobium catenatum]